MEECFTGGAMEDATGDVMCGDLFDHIDDFLDFPNDDDVLDHHRSSDSVAPTSAASAALMVPPLLPPPPTHVGDSSTSSANNGTAVAEESKLKLGPYDDVDIAQLEWLSNFFDDSSDPFPQDFLCDVADAQKNDTVDGASRGTEDDLLFWTSSPVSVLEQHNNLVGGVSATSSSSSCSGVGFGSNHKDHKSTPPPPLSPPEPVPAIPGRARSKRPRPRPASFSIRPAVSIPFPPPSSDMESESFGESNPAPTTFVMAKNKNRKRKKNPLTPNSSDEVEGQAPTVRKCMHCEVTKTPQWRAGPMGPKTLCNACGVRYKSGRLFPEYRPAASPTFSPAVHSNSHKKVVEMRIKTCEKTAGVSATESPALKNCDLIEYIRRRV